MINKVLLFTVCVGLSLCSVAQQKPSSTTKPKGADARWFVRVPPYQMLIDSYTDIVASSPRVKMEMLGPTDTQYPLPVIYCSNSKDQPTNNWAGNKQVRILINNGIHPGEYDGIEASLNLVKEISSGKTKLPDNVVLAIIPSLNIYGTVNLRKYSRANQNGPLVTGFRGNAQNLDLNRDFIKMDAKETQTLAKFMVRFDPDILIDNHVSNGADYQHIMTLLSTQHNKLGGAMGKYLNEVFEPKVYAEMKQRKFDLVPYVNVWGKTPDNGWQAYLETARYLSGFAAMFHSYAFVAETHMLKPYKDRVAATDALMRSIIDIASENAVDIKATRSAQKDGLANATKLPIAWQIDTTQHRTITFKGYEAGYKPSEISGEQRLYYDRNKPYEKQVPHYNTYKPSQTVDVPKAYLVLQGWHKVIEKLENNGVKVTRINRDSVAEVAVSYITDYETVDKPYEGHYLHSDIKVDKVTKFLMLRKGDYLVQVEQPAKRYIVETLEATSPDGFFAWGFFDGILQQKEWYSPYVFEDLAVKLLEEDPKLKEKFEARKKTDAEFAKDGKAQLYFIYRNSEYHEPEHMRYPVYRLE